MILPYRLEMGTVLTNQKGKNLYEFWGNTLTDAVNSAVAAQRDNIIINLASNEYFKAIKPKLLNAQLITPVFKDFKNGQYKVISFFAKRARGMMARYIIDQQVSSTDGLKAFEVDGYYYSEDHSKPNEPTFLREAQ